MNRHGGSTGAGSSRRGRWVTALLFVLTALVSASLLPAAGVAASPAPVSASPDPGWTSIIVDDPAIELPVPAGWRSISPSEFVEEIEALMPDVPTDSRAALLGYIEQVRGGRIPAILRGERSYPGGTATATVTLEFQPEAASAEEGAALYTEVIGHPPDSVIETPADLAVGSGVRVISSGDTDGGTLASVQVRYHLELPDGRVAALLAVSPAIDLEFPSLVDKVAQGMRFVQPGLLAGLFVASPEDVEAWDLGLGDAEWPAVEVDLLEIHLGTLESILTGTPYDDISADGLHDIVRQGGDEGPWVIRVRPQLVDALAGLEDGQIGSVAAEWAGTDEFKLDPSAAADPATITELAALLPEMRALARTSQKRDLPMYLLMSL